MRQTEAQLKLTILAIGGKVNRPTKLTRSSIPIEYAMSIPRAFTKARPRLLLMTPHTAMPAESYSCQLEVLGIFGEADPSHRDQLLLCPITNAVIVTYTVTPRYLNSVMLYMAPSVITPIFMRQPCSLNTCLHPCRNTEGINPYNTDNNTEQGCNSGQI